MAEYETKSCPFCGCNETKLVVNRKGNQRDIFVKCRRCNARSGAIIAPGWGNVEEYVKAAIAYWDARVGEDANDG